MSGTVFTSGTEDVDRLNPVRRIGNVYPAVPLSGCGYTYTNVIHIDFNNEWPEATPLFNQASDARLSTWWTNAYKKVAGHNVQTNAGTAWLAGISHSCYGFSGHGAIMTPILLPRGHWFVKLYIGYAHMVTGTMISQMDVAMRYNANDGKSRFCGFYSAANDVETPENVITQSRAYSSGFYPSWQWTPCSPMQGPPMLDSIVLNPFGDHLLKYDLSGTNPSIPAGAQNSWANPFAFATDTDWRTAGGMPWVCAYEGFFHVTSTSQAITWGCSALINDGTELYDVFFRFDVIGCVDSMSDVTTLGDDGQPVLDPWNPTLIPAS